MDAQSIFCGSQTPQLHLDNIFLAELLSIILSVPMIHHCLQSFISIVFSSLRCSPNHHWLLSLALLAFAKVFDIEKPISFFESYWQRTENLAWEKASIRGMLYNFIIILSQMHYKGLLCIAWLWAHSWPHDFFFQAWLLFGAIPASVVCCLCHFCLHLILHLLHWWQVEKKVNMFILQNSLKWLPSKFWKRQECDKFSMILPRKCIHALGSIYFVVWHDKVSIF